MDFGTRRRFSREVQRAIVKRLQQGHGSSAPAAMMPRVAR